MKTSLPLSRLLPYLLLVVIAAPAIADSPEQLELKTLEKRGRDGALTQLLSGEYHRADAELFWHENGVLTVRGGEALQTLLQANLQGIEQHGLSAFVEKILAGERSATQADWQITARLVQLGRRVYGIDRSMFRSADTADTYQSPDLQRLLEDVKASPSPRALLSLWQSDAPGFYELAGAADQYSQMANWPRLTGSGVLSIGDRNPEVEVLKQRLAAEGYDPSAGFDAVSADWDEVAELFSEELSEQLMRYQQHRGLQPDGVLGPNTRASLNISPAQRARQIQLNLARVSALPTRLGDHYIWVNIPEYRLRVVKDGETDFETKVVVGKTRHQTPVFIDHVDYMEVNPYWNVPRSITIDEIAPAMVKDPSHIDRNNMQVLSGWQRDATVLNPQLIDWQGVADGSRQLTFRVRQLPGPTNALGRVKFIMPNDHNVYLHDTPQDALFDRTRRSFSHGCVRLAKPFDMAEYVLANRVDEPTDFRSILNSKEPTRVHLDRPLPTYLVYFTTWIDEQGDLHFRDDIYGHDLALAKNLENEQKAFRNADYYEEIMAMGGEPPRMIASRDRRKKRFSAR